MTQKQPGCKKNVALKALIKSWEIKGGGQEMTTN